MSIEILYVAINHNVFDRGIKLRKRNTVYPIDNLALSVI